MNGDERLENLEGAHQHEPKGIIREVNFGEVQPDPVAAGRRGTRISASGRAGFFFCAGSGTPFTSAT